MEGSGFWWFLAGWMARDIVVGIRGRYRAERQKQALMALGESVGRALKAAQAAQREHEAVNSVFTKKVGKD